MATENTATARGYAAGLVIPKKSFSGRLAVEVWRKVQKLARKGRRSMNSQVNLMLEEWLEDRGL